MVRTVATAVRASGGKSAKAARASTVSTNNTYGGSSSGERHGIGGNPVHPRETPSWQKPITNFFIKQEVNKDKIDNLEGNMREIEESSGEGGSKMSEVLPSDEMEVEKSPNKENGGNCQSEEVKEDVIEEGEVEEEIMPLKKQKLDFYKNLEAIENNSV